MVRFNLSKIKPEPSELAKSIFKEACYIENREEKLGKTLSIEENNIRKFILTQSPILGRIPTIDEIKKEFQKEEVDLLLEKLDRLDIIHLENKTIVAAYPFSGAETSHKLCLKGKKYRAVYAMCAIDALGINFMFEADVLIESSCFHCGDRIEIDMRDDEIIFLNPENTVVWCDREYGDCAATSLCKNINFFSSEKHCLYWRKESLKRKGNLLNIDEALYLGKMFFENRI